MNVANKSIIRKLTWRILRADKRRNFFIAAAIALTALMIASVFSVGMSMYETFRMAPFRSEGIYAHAFLRNLSPENMETLRSLGYVRHVNSVWRVGLGSLDGFDQSLGLAALNEESWRQSHAPVYADVEGRLATAENEIMLSRAHLERMGIAEPRIGMEIPMSFEIGDYSGREFGETRSETFVLSAMYTEFVSVNAGNAYTPIFVSEAFARRHGQLSRENMDVRIVFTSQSRAYEYSQRLAHDLGLRYDTEVWLNPATGDQMDEGYSTMSIAIAIIVMFFMLVGFLLIYNVMYLSVAKDVRFYGLMKTMGTTSKQLRCIVNGQVLVLYAIGLPFGLAAAAVTSFAIVPALISGVSTGTVISFSPLIYAGGAVFAGLTAYIGANVSARKAARVSPIEAVRFTGVQTVNIKPRSSANGKPSRMAWRNIFRERKRASIVLLSMFLGITVFMAVMSVALGMDIAASIESMFIHDISISDSGFEMGDLGLAGMDRSVIEQIASVPGVVEVREQTSGIAWFDYPWADENAEFPFLTIKGIDRAYMEELNEKREKPIDIEAFECGEIVLVDEFLTVFGGFGLGDMLYEHFPIGAELYFEAGQESRIPMSATVAGYGMLEILSGYTVYAGAGLELIVSNTFLESISARGGVTQLGVNIEEGMEESANAAISAIAKECGMAMNSALEAQRAVEEARFSMLILGTTLSGVLALIGLFNFINLISVGLLARKRELATLESVGMSRKQMRLMLRWEGAIYGILTIMASITAGTGIAYGLFRLIQNEDSVLYPRFIYPVWPIACVFALIALICAAAPEICYRGIAKSTLVERLREAE